MKAFSEENSAGLTCTEEEKGAFDICLVYEKIVEGAISETSKVWQLEMFEHKGKVRGAQLYCTSKLFLKPFCCLYLSGGHEGEDLLQAHPN